MKLPDPFTIKLSSIDINTDDRNTTELLSSSYVYPQSYISIMNGSDPKKVLINIKNDVFIELCNVICDQLRYPSKFTLRNISLILMIYENYNNFRELVISCILERLVSHKPHPWGLMVTFLEIIRNETYAFWSEKFINRSPEIRNLFDSIAKTCLNMKINSPSL